MGQNIKLNKNKCTLLKKIAQLLTKNAHIKNFNWICQKRSENKLRITYLIFVKG
jgi:hypothetical protein